MTGVQTCALPISPDNKEQTAPEDKVAVPNVIGSNVEDAIGVLAGQSLKYDMDDGAEDENFVVIKQYPSAGTKVKKGTKVYLYNE